MTVFWITIIAITVNLLTLLITFITSSGALTDNRFKSLRKLKTRGWLFLGSAVVLILVQSAQTYFTNDANKREQDERDMRVYTQLKKNADSSVIAFKVLSDSSVTNFKGSTDSLILRIMQLLAVNKLGYDSSQNVLFSTIKDSAKTKIVQEETPTIYLGVDGIAASTIEVMEDSTSEFNTYKLCLSSFPTTSRKVKLKISIINLKNLAKDQRLFKFLLNSYIFSDSTMIPGKGAACRKFPILKSEKIETLVLWIRGSYQNNDLSKTFSFDQVIYYNSLTKSVGEMVGDTRKQCIALANSFAN